MTTGESTFLLLISIMVSVALLVFLVAQLAIPLPNLAPTNPPGPIRLLSIFTPTPEPTQTLVPPTLTWTPEPAQTLVPPSATPVPPTFTPTPVIAVERIPFAPGATRATVEGNLPANGTKVYVLGMAAGQFIEMSATVGAMGHGLRFSIVGADGTVVRAMGEAYVRTVVPRTQDYYVRLVSGVGATSYRMSVLIPVRIRFAPGTTSTEVTGRLSPGGMRYYVLRALAGQRMIVVPRASKGQLGLVISGADGQVLLSGRIAGDGYDGILPTTQEYLIAVQGLGETNTDYAIEITIPPL